MGFADGPELAAVGFWLEGTGGAGRASAWSAGPSEPRRCTSPEIGESGR